MLLIAANGVTSTASSQKFIEGWKVQGVDTLGCFSLQKIKTFAITKVDLMECDSILFVTQRKISIQESIIQTFREENIALMTERDASINLIKKYKAVELDLTIDVYSLERKVTMRNKAIVVLSSIIGTGIVAAIVLK